MNLPQTCLTFLLYLFSLVSPFSHDRRSTSPTSRRDACSVGRGGFVQDATKCIERSKDSIADSRLFWFGDRWHTKCRYNRRNVHQDVDPIRCYNPSSLRAYHSIGERLLRVRPFDVAYLRNLRLVPVVDYNSEPGSYLGCDHNHTFSTRLSITCAGSCSNQRDDITPWQVRRRPTVGWHDPAYAARGIQGAQHGVQHKPRYTVVIVDVAFGTLHYLAHDVGEGGGEGGKTDFSYVGPLNFRSRTNPLVVAVFEQPNGTEYLEKFEWAVEGDGTFDVQKMMLANKLAGQLIGLTWLPLGSDAYAMEIVRHPRPTNHRGGVLYPSTDRHRSDIPPQLDNCPSLLLNRVMSPHDDVQVEFIPRASLSTVRNWMSITYTMPKVHFTLCCRRYIYGGSAPRTVDSLADEHITPLFTIRPPTVKVMGRSREGEEEMAHFNNDDDLYTVDRRKIRDYIVLMDSRKYTLMLFDAAPDAARGTVARPYLHWMVGDIPAKELRHGFKGNSRLSAGVTLVPYEMPLPASRHDVHRYVYALVEQPSESAQIPHLHRTISDVFRAHHFTNSTCAPRYRGRCFTDVGAIIGRFSLKLRAISWHLSRGDDYSERRRIAIGLDAEATTCASKNQVFYANCPVENMPRHSLYTHRSMLRGAGSRRTYSDMIYAISLFVTLTFTQNVL